MIGKQALRGANTLIVLMETAIIFCSAIASEGKEFHVSTVGDDANDGTIKNPFRTVSRLLSVVRPGDIGRIHSGVYNLNQSTHRSGVRSAPITIKACHGAKVVLKGIGRKPNGGKFLILHDWYVLENIEFCQGATGLWIKGASHNKIINCISHENYYTGMVVSGDGASHNIFKYCDCYDMYDSGGKGGNADGFSVTGQSSTPGPGNAFYACRSFNNSDDGFDVWKAAHPVRFENCLAFRNGKYEKGDGNGFKLGPNKTRKDRHVLIKCLAWSNRSNGFDYNDNQQPQTLLNCIAFNNKRNYKFYAVDGKPSIHDLRNCVSVVSFYDDVLLSSIKQRKINSWNLIEANAPNVLEENFLSTDDSVISAPRKIDGAVPDSKFLRLKTGSVFIDKGVDAGLPYNGSAPDLGPFETESDRSVR